METQQYFFSYSRKDADFVIKLAGDLKKAGINVWVDQLDILPGARWDDSIEKGLRNAGGMLVVLSETSIQSENVMDEVSYALEKGKRVVPLLIHNCDVPFRLARLQYIDFTKDYTSALQYLVQTLNAPETAQPVYQQTPPVESSNKQTAQQKNESSLTQTKHRKNFLIPVIAVAAIIILLALYFLLKNNNPKESLSNANIADSTNNITGIKNATDTTNNTNINNNTAGISTQAMIKKATAAKMNNNFEGTIYWYKQAALAGDKSAYINLGNIYDAFPGRQPNVDSAIYWYLKAADNNATGYNTQQGIAYIQQEANNNKPVCMEFLGHLYMNGFETFSKDDKLAVYWLRKAMNAGNVFAKGFFGIMLYEGRGGLAANRVKGHALISQVYNTTNNNYWKEVLDNHP